MELRHLRYFVAVAEELSFTRAAGRLLMTQPSLSTQMRQLETELGVELFDRSRRSIRLTEAGHVLLTDARQLLDQLERTVEVVRRVGSGEVGQLTIGFVPSASNRVLPRVLRAFRARRPEIELFLRELPPDELRRSLHERRTDVGFLYLPFDDESLRQRTILAEPLVAALPAGHRLARAGRSIGVAELKGEPFVLPRHYAIPGYQARVLLACEQAGFQPEIVQKDVWLMQTVTGLVAAGVGVAIVPASERNLHRDEVVYCTLHGPVPTIELGIAWRRDEGSPVLRQMLAAADEATEQFRQAGAADAA